MNAAWLRIVADSLTGVTLIVLGGTEMRRLSPSKGEAQAELEEPVTFYRGPPLR